MSEPVANPVANPVASFTETGLISQFSNRNRFDFEVGSRRFLLRSALRSPLPDASCEGQKLPSDHPAKPPPRFLSTRRLESREVAGSCSSRTPESRKSHSKPPKNRYVNVKTSSNRKCRIQIQILQNISKTPANKGFSSCRNSPSDKTLECSNVKFLIFAKTPFKVRSVLQNLLV